MSFANKVVLVTGASSGIGAATAILFTREGANVVIVGRNQTKLNIVTDKCEKAGKKPLVINADVSKDNEAKVIIDKTISTYGKLDVLVNNAGFSRYGSILDGKILECFDEMVPTNLRAVINLTTLAAPHIIKTKGNIVNVSSVASITTPYVPEFLPYSVTKAGVDHFTRGAALELAASGVRVNSVNPGPVATDFLLNAGFTEANANAENYSDLTPLKRVSQPDEIADLIFFLASDKARSITGSVYLCDNGIILKGK